MKSRLPTIFLLLLCLLGIRGWAAPPESGQDARMSFFVEPLLQKGFGGTSYDLSAYDTSSGNTVLSRLEFPQVSLEAGAVFGLTINRGGKREWLIEAAASHSTLPMSGTMYDYDWFQVPGYPKIPISYTESDDSTVDLHASLDVAWTFSSSDTWSLALYGTYRFQDTSHAEDSILGWQYNGSDYTLYNLSTRDVLEYSLTSHTIGLGLLGSLQPFPRFSLEMRACFTPVYVSDRDDHVLRTKLSTASGWGMGLYSDLKAVYRFDEMAGGVIPYVALDGDVTYYVVNTVQTQYWYGNADAANGAPQGTKITGVGHVITSAQYRIGLRLGFSL
jgi:hypothetical protein